MVDLRPDHLAIVRAILRAEVPFAEVWVFGSRARWTARDTSDLDLLLEVEEPIPLVDLQRLGRAFEDSYLPFSVDLLDGHRIEEDFRALILAERVLLWARSSGTPRRVARLSDCARLLTGNWPRVMNTGFDGGIAWATPADLHSLRLGDTREHVSRRQAWVGSVVPAGTVLVAVEGKALRAPIPVAVTTREMAVHPDLRALRPLSSVDPLYLAYVLVANREALLSIIDRPTGQKARIHLQALESFPIPLPLLAEQRSIVLSLSSLEDKIDSNRRIAMGLYDASERLAPSKGSAAVDAFLRRRDIAESESRLLVGLRNSLLPKLLSGEIRIRDADTVIAAA